MKAKSKLKLVSLNVWGGYLTKELLDFLGRNSAIDIFCFQEIYKDHKKVTDYDKSFNHNIYDDIASVLPDHIGHFVAFLENSYGLAIFVKKGIEVLKEGRLKTYCGEEKNKGKFASHPRSAQWMQCKTDSHFFSIINVHGLWSSKSTGKTDSEERLLQSKIIKQFLDSIGGHKIICGDFNLRPDTKSIEILEEGMTNLIKKYQVESTRSSIYKKHERFADYIFLSPEIKVLDFEVWNDTVSDHCPLYLAFVVDEI